MKKAPYYNQQVNQCEPFNDWLILVGNTAKQAYYRNNEAGKGTHWQMIRDRYRLPIDYVPVILDSKTFQEIDRLQLAPAEQRSIKLFQVGEIPTLAKDKDDLKTRILMNLAKHNGSISAIEWLDEALQGENLYQTLEQIKQGNDTVAEVLEQIQAQADKTEQQKTYIEKRTENGKTGLYRVTPKYDKDTGELLSERTEWLSDVISVIGIGQSEAEHFLVLEWTPEGKQQPIKYALSLGDLGEREGWKQLKEKGLRLTTKNYLRNELADHLQNSGERTFWHITNSTGWHYGAYILPNGEVLGESETPVLFNRQSATASGYDTKGTLESWKTEIADNVLGNPSMMLSIACALSAPLMNIIEAESFGVHLFGGSTTGKTTTTNIASSLYGHPNI